MADRAVDRELAAAVRRMALREAAAHLGAAVETTGARVRRVPCPRCGAAVTDSASGGPAVRGPVLDQPLWGGEATRHSTVLVRVLACEEVTARSLLPAFRRGSEAGAQFQTRAVTAAELMHERGSALDFAEWVHLVDIAEARGSVRSPEFGVVRLLPTSSRAGPWAVGRGPGAVPESSFLFPHAVPGSSTMQSHYRDVLLRRVRQRMERSGRTSA
ncbi:hypothetical protein ACFY12_32965 [Streptomyces sp. NPDC001339]|uniref:hypothetical protein n=1 Tax=Streptomyces sp. NPDC001339 TaxID=3364563 RepID=UPI0036C907C4